MNQLLRRQIVKTVTELPEGKTGRWRWHGQTQAFHAERGINHTPLGLLGLNRKTTALNVTGGARSYPGAPPLAQHPPPPASTVLHWSLN